MSAILILQGKAAVFGLFGLDWFSELFSSLVSFPTPTFCCVGAAFGITLPYFVEGGRELLSSASFLFCVGGGAASRQVLAMGEVGRGVGLG